MPDPGMDPFTPFDPASIDSKLSGLSEGQRGAFWRLYTRGQKNLDAQWRATRSDLLGLFRDTAKDLTSGINETFDAMNLEEWDLATMRRTGRKQFLLRQVVDRIRALGANVNATIEAAAVRQFEQTYAYSAYSAESLGAPRESIAFGMMPDYAIMGMIHQDFQGADFSERVGLITDEMAHRVQMELTRSMIAQESWGQAARRIRDSMGVRGRAAVARAETIARTELRRASSLGSWQFRQENEDLIDKTVWLAHAGACQECIDLDGEELSGPEDYPPNASHPNCTCSHMDLPANRTYLGMGAVAKVPQPFEEWAADRGAISYAVGGTE